ncbi:carnitine dehydratase [Agromyces protaetiae]|uniref:Carnitine dehydratase n=1 Tax=Agromyces protaetiae TaxID=2509455 RepID=A0A4P6FDS7_9MICO|nr:CoA transferase [Agromyces protaetiae]QAY74282.1 carnitine dehydratase [Agromyces protaetiae]
MDGTDATAAAFDPRRVLARAWRELGRDESELALVGALPEPPLPARLDVAGLAADSVAAASFAAAIAAGGERVPALRLSGARIATAFGSERVFAIDGVRPAAWAPLSGFWQTSDGWVRTHANYPHHAAALRRVLGLSADAEGAALASALESRTAADVSADVTAAGGLCVVVSREDPADTAARAAAPLIELVDSETSDRRPLGASRPVGRPLDGIRVLDLTRVIAGPVATRTLGLFGAEVLRIDPPEPAEIGWQHLDSGAGKRSALLDLRSRSDRRRFDDLLAAADVLVLGYRPASLERLGLDPRTLAARHPSLVIAQLSAWGFGPGEAERAGFDSLVQAESGIAWIESPDGERPGALPVQALDHATGYLLAAAVTTVLDGRGATDARGVRMSLRRTAAELLGGPRTPDRSPAGELGDDDRVAEAQHLVGSAGDVVVPRPAAGYVGSDDEWMTPPHAWGSDTADWA